MKFSRLNNFVIPCGVKQSGEIRRKANRSITPPEHNGLTGDEGGYQNNQSTMITVEAKKWVHGWEWGLLCVPQFTHVLKYS